MSNSTPWTVACQAPLSMRFPRQDHWSALPFPSPGDLPDPGINPASPALQVDSLPLSHWGNPLSMPESVFSHPILFSVGSLSLPSNELKETGTLPSPLFFSPRPPGSSKQTIQSSAWVLGLILSSSLWLHLTVSFGWALPPDYSWSLESPFPFPLCGLASGLAPAV